MLTTRFEELYMKDDETLADFYSRVCDITNDSFSISERIPESKLVWKIVRSLPDRFQSNAIIINESKNLDIMKIDELMGSFQTFELNLRQKKKKINLLLSNLHKKNV